jgi:hypothetical protein
MYNIDSFSLMKYKYEEGVYSLEDMCDFLEKGYLNEIEFHLITGYQYKGVKKEGSL